jgi:hypothetical protein
MSRLNCFLVIILPPFELGRATGHAVKRPRNAPGSLGDFNWRHWGIILVPVQIAAKTPKKLK